MWLVWGTQLKLSGNGESKLKLSGNGNDCKPLPRCCCAAPTARAADDTASPSRASCSFAYGRTPVPGGAS